MTELKTLDLHVAPLGMRSGLLLAAGGSNRLSILVLPKVWRLDGAPKRASWTGDGLLQLVLYEGDHCRVACTERQSDLLDEVNDHIRQERGATEGDGQADSLLTVHHRNKPVPEEFPVARSWDESAFTSLLALTLLARTADAANRPDMAATDLPAGPKLDPVQSSEDSPALRLLQHWEFVRLVEARIREIRRGYVERREILPVVRGRLTSGGVVMHAMTGSPDLECEFDEFTESTPLYRILVTALDVVASGTVFRGVGNAGWNLSDRVCNQAGHLRRYLASIPSLSPRKARVLAERLYLPRLFESWRPVLEHARQVLSEHIPRMKAVKADADVSSLSWWVATDKLWEYILLSCLSRTDEDTKVVCEDEIKRTPEVEVDDPWSKLGKAKRPDLLFRFQDGKHRRFWAMDAKYKPFSGTPTRNDQYQIFAYSHISRWQIPGGWQHPDACALLYPEYLHGESFSCKPPPLRGGDSAPIPLLMMTIKFPSPGEIVDPQGWNAWVQRNGASVFKKLKSSC